MAAQVFVDKSTVIPTAWLNDVNTTVWTVLNGATTAALARTALGSTATGDALFTTANATAARTTLGAAASGTNSDITSLTGISLLGTTAVTLLNETLGTAVASAATINLTTTTGNLVHITGVVTITAVTLGSGMRRRVIFDGALTLTHHATNNNLPGGVNITTASGDRAEYWSDGTTVYCTEYTKASGKAVIPSISAASLAASGYLTLSNGIIIQWGVTPVSSASADVAGTWPIPFPTAVWSAVPAAGGNSGNAFLSNLAPLTLSGYSYGSYSAYATRHGTDTCTYIAIGN